MSTGGSYDPRSSEPDIYKFWEDGGYFHAERDPSREPYVIDIPLPNVTGALHLGHALNNTVQDVLIRHKRMCGYNALWMPGTDHAGIATQAVVEKRLKEDENLTRHEIGREALVKRIWAWKEKYGDHILHQLRQMGFSCDWQRARFTLDEVCAKAVFEVFFRWFKDGLIFRGLRLVNWDAHLQTAVADDEIVHETVKGHLWDYRYPILRSDEATERRSDDGGGLPEEMVRAALKRAAGDDAKLGEDYLVIATTRPETMLGDTAVAVHPDDERYKHLIGRVCLLPLQNRAIPIIADGILVKREFGTGCVKVTPGHDPNDYACAQRHGLDMINILTTDGRINENGGAYAGMSFEAARKQVVADIEAAGLLEKVEPYETEIGHSDRSKTPIQPMLSEQWWVRMAELAETAMEAVRDGRMQFFPARYARTYLDWLSEKRDWCISRQLWWGHRIPVWSRRMSLAEFRTLLENDGASIAAAAADPNCCVRVVPENEDGFEFGDEASRTKLRGMNAETPLDWFVCLRDPDAHWPADDSTVGERLERDSFERDPDVLDTWFSSALWPFSTLGWPDNYGKDRSETGPTDFDYFYPTSTLVTGRGIITLWVARMAMTSLYFNNRVPFRHVHIHPMIQDGQGRTMSKSLGNGVDPLDIIAHYGTDALRFTMVQMDTETQDVRMPVKPVKLSDGRTVNTSEKFELGRNLCNKLWQAATGFVIPSISSGATAESAVRSLTREDLELEDRWILSRLSACIAECDRRFERYQLSEVANTLYAFFWSDFCDWYVELVKPRIQPPGETGPTAESGKVARQVLTWVMDQTLRLMHPIMPFVTEAIWKRLNEAAPRRGIDHLREAEPALIAAAWPDAAAWPREVEVEDEMKALQDVIRALREIRTHVNTLRADNNEPSIRTLPAAIINASRTGKEMLGRRRAILIRLGQVADPVIQSGIRRPPRCFSRILSGGPAGRIEVYVPLAGLADPAAERQRLEQERDKLVQYVKPLMGKLSNEGFLTKAPATFVEKEKARLEELKARIEVIEQNIKEIGT